MALNEQENSYFDNVCKIFIDLKNREKLWVSKIDNTFYYDIYYSSSASLSASQLQDAEEMIKCLKVDLLSEKAQYQYIAKRTYFTELLLKHFNQLKTDIKSLKKSITVIDNQAFYLNQISRQVFKNIKMKEDDTVNNMIELLDFPTNFISYNTPLNSNAKASREVFDYYISIVSRTLKKLPKKREQIIQSLTNTVKNSPNLDSMWVVEAFLMLFKDDLNVDNLLENTGYFEKKQVFKANEMTFSSFMINETNFTLQYKKAKINDIVQVNQYIDENQIDFPKIYVLSNNDDYFTICVENKGQKPIEKAQHLIDLFFTQENKLNIAWEDLIFKAKMDVDMLHESKLETVKKVKNKI
jgi:hypothetical protein